MKQAWVAGATGLVGSHLVDELVRRRAYSRVNCLVRMGMTPRVHQEDVVRDVPIDYDKPLRLEASDGDDFFCCLGTTIKKAGTQERFRRVDHDYVVRFAEVAKRYAAHVFVVVSAMGADPRSGVFYSRVKGEMEDSVRALGLRSVWVLRPSLLLGKRGEFRFGEELATIMAPFFSPLMVGPLRRYRPIAAADVAKAAAVLAKRDEIGFRVLSSDEVARVR